MTKKQRVSREEGIDLVELIQTFWKHKFLILALMIIGAFAMIIKTAYLTEPDFTSSGILYVSNRKEQANENAAILKSDIDTSRTLSTTYIEILKTSKFLDEVGEAIGSYTHKDILRFVTISTINDTELLKVTTTTRDPRIAYLITKNILDKAPAKLKSVYKKGEVELVDPPRYPEKENDRNVARNALIGMLAGFVLGAFIAFEYNFFDTRVRRGEDVAQRYNISILGEISE